MTTPLQSLIATGTKLWLDSVDPELVAESRAQGATGATSNPIIIADLVKTGRFDADIALLASQGLDDEQIAWQMTDRLVRQAQEAFADVHRETSGNDGYVSFELDPLLEDADCPLSTQERTARYVELAQQWAQGHTNRMIKIPATPAGLACVEDVVAAGVTPNVTLIFSQRQYELARDAAWHGAQRRPSLEGFKSVYSIFVSRIDVYTEKQLPSLSPAAQGEVGIVNAKRIWQANHGFWADKSLALDQEIIFASTGTKKPTDPVDKYVASLAGSDIQTNPPATNAAIQQHDGTTFTRRVDQMPPADVLGEIDEKVDFARMQQTLMDEGLRKFADPQKALIALIAEKRESSDRFA
ncbi:MAG: transaldolase [Planctomycetaceae bacterium]|nr:transaldolase [Planctomycetaceae bacterium]